MRKKSRKDRQKANWTRADIAPLQPKVEVDIPARRSMQITDAAVMESKRRLARKDSFRTHSDPVSVFRPCLPAPGVAPPGHRLAMDEAMPQNVVVAYQAQFGHFFEGVGFLGYPYLAELSQRPEYRRPAEIVAQNIVRKWIKISATGDDSKADRVRELTKELDRLQVQRRIYQLALNDALFGRAQLFMDFGADLHSPELSTPLRAIPEKVARGSLQRLVVVEPVWTCPSRYNADNPLAYDFYKPSSWLVMGTDVHSSRLLTYVARPVPDYLKPSYNFGGLSMSQLMKPYVDEWIRTKISVADLIHSFTVFWFKTNMDSVLSGEGGSHVRKRAEIFCETRDNNNLLMLDRETEELGNLSAPLSSLDKLQAQAQEHICSANGVPLVMAFGITPSGLNASSESEIEIFDDRIMSERDAIVDPILKTVIDFVMVSLWGEIDLDITYAWEPLRSMTAKELAELRKSDAESDCMLIDHAVLAADEVRQQLAAEEDGRYSGLDLDREIEPPMPDTAELDDHGEAPQWGRLGSAQLMP